MGLSLIQNEDGYYSVNPLPSIEQLSKYYQEYYSGQRDNQYQHEYTNEEIQNKYVTFEETAYYAPYDGRKYLELGVGEGFMISEFFQKGWDTKGIDYTNSAIIKFFPELINKIVVGNVFEAVSAEIRAGNHYDYIVCNNVLEHVIDPEKLLKDIRDLLRNLAKIT